MAVQHTDLFGVPETFATEIEFRESEEVTYLVVKNHTGPAHCVVMTAQTYRQILQRMFGSSSTLN